MYKQTIKKTENWSPFPSPKLNVRVFFLEMPDDASEVPSKGDLFCSKGELSITMTHPSWLENSSLVSPPCHHHVTTTTISHGKDFGMAPVDVTAWRSRTTRLEGHKDRGAQGQRWSTGAALGTLLVTNEVS